MNFLFELSNIPHLIFRSLKEQYFKFSVLEIIQISSDRKNFWFFDKMRKNNDKPGAGRDQGPSKGKLTNFNQYSIFLMSI